jgi:amino acid permease
MAITDSAQEKSRMDVEVAKDGSTQHPADGLDIKVGEQQQLKRPLKPRHIQMIAIGGVIVSLEAAGYVGQGGD